MTLIVLCIVDYPSNNMLTAQILIHLISNNTELFPLKFVHLKKKERVTLNCTLTTCA